MAIQKVHARQVCPHIPTAATRGLLGVPRLVRPTLPLPNPFSLTALVAADPRSSTRVATPPSRVSLCVDSHGNSVVSATDLASLAVDVITDKGESAVPRVGSKPPPKS